MKPLLVLIIALSLMISFWVSSAAVGYGQSQKDTTNLSFAEWVAFNGEKNSSALIINIRDHVSKRQKELVTSGFSTFSRVIIRRLSDNGIVELQPLVELACTVKYDLWQEQYELARLEENPTTANVSKYEEYASKCLEVTLNDPAVLDQLATGKKLLVASLIFDQISAQKEEKIRQWLVEQQSGVMKGLFANMLGELKMNERIDILVEIPSRGTKVRTIKRAKQARGD